MNEKLNENHKYRVTWEVTFEVEAKNPYDAASLANQKWKNGKDDMLHFCIEEVK